MHSGFGEKIMPALFSHRKIQKYEDHRLPNIVLRCEMENRVDPIGIEFCACGAPGLDSCEDANDDFR
jgi:hypothetical protein